MIKKVKCNVCNYKFNVNKDKIYEVTENKGITAIMSGSDTFDATNCPRCGCQKILWKRLPRIETEKVSIPNEEIETL